MKKLRVLFVLCLAALCLFFAVGCKKSLHFVLDGEFTIIRAEIDNVSENASLKDYMDYLKEAEGLSFEMRDGMILSINGKKGASNEYWMLYTDDAENANDAWGTCEYEGKTYGSATVGAEDLKIKDGCTYIWCLQAF